MARTSYEYHILTGEANEGLASNLTQLSSTGGWEVAGVSGDARNTVVLLIREQDFEVGKSLQHALEESESVEAIGIQIPPEERT